MNNNTIYVGMDVHKESFTLCAFTIEEDKGKYHQKTDPDFKKVLRYLDFLRSIYGDDAKFVCGYEAGCLGFTLYHELSAHNVKCVILAPTTMPVAGGKKKIKADKRDAAHIARCLAHHDYSPVHIPTEQDEQVKEYLRMRDDHKLALKKVKQQILSFCLRHGYHYDGTKNHWTQAHLNWLRTLKVSGLYQETLEEYLLTYDYLTAKLAQIDRRIEDLADDEAYRENVSKLRCFIGIKTQTALSVITETGDFNRFPDASHYAAYLGLVPGEDSSGGDQHRLGITKAGNRHLRMLLVEASQSYARGQAGHKSKALADRQEGNRPTVIQYADKANERLRRKYYRLTLKNGKKANVAKTAIARELACFIWGMMTEKYA